MKSKTFFLLVICGYLLAACSSAPATEGTLTHVDVPTRAPAVSTVMLPKASVSPTVETATPASATAALLPGTLPPAQSTRPTQPDPPAATATLPPAAQPITAALTSPAPMAPVAWQELPVIPAISPHAKEIYQRGLELGNNPHAFSKVGDCGSTPTWFLGDFDRGPQYYRLGADNQGLTGAIQQFQGSFDRTSLAARAGFNAASLFTPLWADRSQCQPDETPLACELRVQRPAIVFIMLGANDVWHPENFEPQMRKIIEFSIEHGVIPVLSTKADNQEGDGSLNATVARLAAEYDVPLLNFWRATAFLPNHGLQEDNVHLTWAGNLFDDPQAMQKGWPVRNLTSLQMLDAIWRSVTGQ